jgi:hypothetical protein
MPGAKLMPRWMTAEGIEPVYLVKGDNLRHRYEGNTAHLYMLVQRVLHADDLWPSVQCVRHVQRRLLPDWMEADALLPMEQPPNVHGYLRRLAVHRACVQAKRFLQLHWTVLAHLCDRVMPQRLMSPPDGTPPPMRQHIDEAVRYMHRLRVEFNEGNRDVATVCRAVSGSDTWQSAMCIDEEWNIVSFAVLLDT